MDKVTRTAPPSFWFEFMSRKKPAETSNINKSFKKVRMKCFVTKLCLVYCQENMTFY